MRYKIPLIIITVFFSLAIWYFSLKDWDYRLYFTVKSSSGVVYQNVNDWNIWNRKLLHENFQITAKEPWEKVDTQVMVGDTTLQFHWQFKQKNDSITRVIVGISDPDRKFLNRLRIPFVETEFEKQVSANVKDIKEKINAVNQSFAFEFVGESDLAETPCVYISTKSTHRGKAREMMNNVITLNQFVRQNELGLNGQPFLQVNQFNFTDDTIHFDFCFPILYPEKVPDHSIIEFKNAKLGKALKANFYGNYSISDMSWYLLSEKVTERGLESNGQIIERYFNDPHSGGNDLEWKAEIYMGVK